MKVRSWSRRQFRTSKCATASTRFNREAAPPTRCRIGQARRSLAFFLTDSHWSSVAPQYDYNIGIKRDGEPIESVHHPFDSAPRRITRSQSDLFRETVRVTHHEGIAGADQRPGLACQNLHQHLRG